MSKNTSVNVSSTGCTSIFLALFQTLLIGLKLTGYVEWEWWIVLLPSIAYIITAGLMFAAVLVFILIALILSKD